MTSSWLLEQRKKNWPIWSISNFGNPDNSLGGWEDHYIVDGAHRECHPDYQAIPMGNPYGFMVCKKKKYPDGRGLDTPHDPIDPSGYNGYNKYQADLYRPWRETAIQITDPYNYYDRTIPNEEFLHRRDYIARETQYNGTGVTPIHTPGPRKYREYGFAYSDAGEGVVAKPPYKYDVTQLHQRYPQWKEIQIYHGVSQEEMDEVDKTYFESVPSSTW